MSDKIEFTRNHTDQSTNQGFQFEFYCDRCGTGYRTRFQTFALGTATQAMDAANSLFGGIFGKAANLTERARSAAWEKAHDDAFVKAMEDLKPDFMQCPRCSSWVCRKGCWNTKKGLCKNCAPDMGVEMFPQRNIKDDLQVRFKLVYSFIASSLLSIIVPTENEPASLATVGD